MGRGDASRGLGAVRRVRGAASSNGPYVAYPSVGVDELIRQSGGSAGEVQIALLELEIAGMLVRHAGGTVSVSQGSDEE